MQKLAFFVKQGLDSFLRDIIINLSEEYEVEKIIITDTLQIEDGMKWADICWFEWCDELIAYASKHELAKKKKMICRLHSYEAFTAFPASVDWDTIDKLICVAQHIKDYIVAKFKLDLHKIEVIPNGIDVNQYTFRARTTGYKIAYVGYINYKKGPMLLLHTIKAICDMNPQYQLYIAGEFQDERDILYFNQMVKELKLEKNVRYEGWQQHLDEWLEDKDYILCTSILESQNISVMQAMAKGIKPIIHNFVGARAIYTSEYVWNTIAEAVDQVTTQSFDSEAYRNFIITNYSLSKQMQMIRKCIKELLLEETELRTKPLVTIGIINYNYKKYLETCIHSVLKQTYDNIDILIIDDCSTDGSVDLIKNFEKISSNISGLFHQENSGSAVLAFQEIIRKSQGKYFLILSADDFLASDHVLEQYVKILEYYDELDYVHGNLRIVDEEGNEKNVWKYAQYRMTDLVRQIFKRGGSGVVPITVGLHRTDFFRRNALTWYDDIENTVASDTLNSLIFTKYGWNYKYIDMDAMNYRQHGNNMTQNVAKRVKSVISVLEYIINNFDKALYLEDVSLDEASEALKAYLIGKRYWELLITYYNGEWQPWDFASGSGCNTLEVLQPIVDKIRNYFNTSLGISQTFSSKIQVIQEELRQITKEKTVFVANGEALRQGISQSEIYFEGQQLKKSLLEKYHLKASKRLNFLILSPDNGAWFYSFNSWKQILEYMGHGVSLIFDKQDMSIDDRYDVFITIANGAFIDEMEGVTAILGIPTKIGIASKESFYNDENTPEDIKVRNRLLVGKTFDFLISGLSNEAIQIIFKEWVGIGVCSIPFGFNPLLYYPLNTLKEFDYFYVGTNSYIKADETKKLLRPIVNGFKGIIRGVGWGEHISSLDPTKTSYFYNRAKINLNYHLACQKELKNEVNERTYIISACGSFQLTDNPKLLQELYKDTEIAIASDEKEYIDQFNFYMNKPLLRNEMAYNALVKTYQSSYSLFHRMDQLIGLILKEKR